MTRVARQTTTPRSWQHDRRHALVLDLFTKYGPLWTDVVAHRQQWGITPETALPPYPPPGDLAALGVLTREQMPERIFLPPIPQIDGGLHQVLSEHDLPMFQPLEEIHIRARLVEWRHALRDLFGAHVPEAAQSADDRQAWTGWAPFFSACLCFDPPDTELIAFAAYEDVEAASLPKLTHWQDPDAVQAASDRRTASLRRLEDFPSSPERERAAMVVQVGYVRDLAATWRESAGASDPLGSVGQPTLSPLRAVQCAIFKDRYGWTHETISDHMGWPLTKDAWGKPRRANRSIRHVTRGRAILKKRKYSSQ